MFTSFTFWLVILAALVAYLCVSVCLRQRALARAERARLRAIEREFPPRAFDTSAVAPQVERVRQDYVESAHRRWHAIHNRAELLAAARRVVTSLAYFCCFRDQHESQKHDA
jgi:hypothetical protein